MFCAKFWSYNWWTTVSVQNSVPLHPIYANKPDKFGIKFWLLVDVRSKYLCNGKLYLGKDPTRNRENDLPADVCLWLMQPFLIKGYNVTMDNYFTSINLADKLKTEKTTIRNFLEQ